MKKTFTLLFAIIIVLSCMGLASCKRPAVYPELTVYDGWWKRPEGYVSDGNRYLSDTIEISADDATVTCYGKYGIPSAKYSCSAEENDLVVFIEAIGKMRFYADGDSLVNKESGVVEYVKGEAVETVDISAFCGKWYRDGNVDSDYYEISTESYNFYFAHMPSTFVHTGTWESSSSVRYTTDGKGYDEVLLNLTNLTVSKNFKEKYEYALLCGGIVMYDNASADFYVRADAIREKKADEAISKMLLVTEEWSSESGSGLYLSFDFYSSSVKETSNVTSSEGSVSTQTVTVGKWNIDKNTLHIEFSDGRKESISFTKDTQKIKLAAYDTAFVRD